MAESRLQLVLVTPETTLLDEPVTSLRFPLFDGQVGVFPGRAPLVGRLGCGELVAKTASGEQSFFLDGGFVQIKGSVVTLLTGRATLTSELDAADADSQMEEAKSIVARNDVELLAKEEAVDRARRMGALARKAH